METPNSTHDQNGNLLALVALFEGDFSIDWIVQITKEKISWILCVLEEGTKQGILTKKGPGTFCFRDLEKQQELKESLASDEKQRIYRQIADLFIRELPDDEDKAVLISKYLYHLTNNDVNGIYWLIKAGDIYCKAYHSTDALKCYTKALDDLSRLSGEEADSLFTKTAINYSKVSTAHHDTRKILSVLNNAIERTKKLHRKDSQAILEMHIAKNEWLRSRYQNALRHFEKGWSIAKELNDPKLLRSATTFSTFYLYWLGRFKEAVQSYEKFIPEVEKFPQGRFPLLGAILVARCYAMIGNVTQGLGMMDGIRTHCLERGDRYSAAHAGYTIGATMLDICRIDEAIQYLECSLKEATQEHAEWVRIRGNVVLALAYYLNGNNKQSISCLQEYLLYTQQVNVNVSPYSYLMELCWAIEQGKLPRIGGLSLEKEIQHMIRNNNVFMKGIAHRYKALLERQKDVPHDRIIESLKFSLKSLEDSGHQIEQARSQLELARQYLLVGNEQQAREIILNAAKILNPFGEALIPDDLKSFANNPPSEQNLLKEILKLGQEVVTIRENKDLSQHIISTVNQITGAERGAMFLIEENTNPPRFLLRASKNLTSNDTTHPNFNSSLKLIEEVARSGEGRILRSFSNNSIRSCICVPMVLRDKIVGILYHDNRLLSSAFKQSDLELLAYFAAQAAFALDNTKAYEEVQRLNQKLREEKLYLQEQHSQNLHFEEILGESSAIKRVLSKVDQVARTDSTVLILGETGVGKELIARAIHRHSPRRDKPFIAVPCSALSENLITSELFGHEKGAFTGATHRRIGRFELADGGTLFLDEIGELPMEVQVRLLRVLQNKEFERVGGSETLHSDFRLVAATNRDLEQYVKINRFRADLYYRLNIFPIHIPPLRERREDIPLLARYFIKIYGNRLKKTFEKIPDSEMEKLIRYDWPGNVRELENIIERGAILSFGPTFLVPELSISSTEFSGVSNETSLQENERRHIIWALQKTGWKVRGLGGAAELLKIHPSTLAFRMKKLGIQRPSRYSHETRTN
jgi:transcriptional regulator with GAF, ATPase, and Fis domain